MKAPKVPLLLMLAALLTFSSCTYRLIDFTVISSKSNSLNVDKSQGIRVSGKSYGFLGLGAEIKDAMDKALESAGPEYDLLIDGVVRVEDYFFVSGYKVEGTAISSRKMKAMLGKEGFEAWCSANNLFDLSATKTQN